MENNIQPSVQKSNSPIVPEFDTKVGIEIYNAIRKSCPSAPSALSDGTIVCKLRRDHNDYFEYFHIQVRKLVEEDNSYSVVIREVHNGAYGDDYFVDHTFYFSAVSEVVSNVIKAINRLPLANRADGATVLHDYSDFNAVLPYTVIIDNDYTVWKKHYFDVWQSTDGRTRSDQEMADNNVRGSVLFQESL